MKFFFITLTLGFVLLFISHKVVADNIDSAITWSYYQGWYESGHSYYYYTGTKIDSIINWSYYQGWYESGHSYFYYTGNKIDSVISWTYYQGWYESGHSYYYYTGSSVDSVYDYAYYQGWYLANISYYTYNGNCIDSITGFSYNQGWYESAHSHYYNQGDCDADSIYMFSFYQGWYESAHSYYYYHTQTTVEHLKTSLKLTAFPNPAHDKFVLKADEGLEKINELQLYNVTGEKLNIPFIKNENEIIIDATALKAGIYFLKVIGQDSYNTLKLFKE